MYCRKCGKCIPDDSDFCSECGATLKETPQQHNERIAAENEIIEHKRQKRTTVTKRIFITLMLLGILFGIFMLVIYPEMHMEFIYELTDDGRCIITGYKSEVTDVIIPDTICYKPVFTVAANTFKDSDITSVTLGKYVRLVGESAFENCQQLAAVTFNNMTDDELERSRLGNAAIMSRAFANCTSLERVEMPRCTTNIMSMAFSNCSSLKSISLKTARTIEMCAFSKCVSLKTLQLGACYTSSDGYSNFVDRTSDRQIPGFVDTVTLSPYAFEFCTGLEEISIQTEEIPEGCFSSCTNLKTFHGDTISQISDNAFNGCINLTEVSLNNSDTVNIASNAYAGCTKLRNSSVY